MSQVNIRPPKIIAIFITLLALLLTIIQPAAAQEVSTSDLVIQLVSAPKHAKACETFDVIYTITNLGPDKAVKVNLGIGIPDPFETMQVQGVPVSLAAGESVTVTATLKVTAFVPGESRNWWITGSAWSDVYPDISIDPNPDNNQTTGTIKLISKREITCP